MDPKATYWVSDLPFTQLANGYNYVQVDKSNGGKGLKLGSTSYAKGLGTNSASKIAVPLHKKFDRFQSDIGIDAETSGGSAAFQVIGDGKTLYTSSVLKGGGSPVSVDVSVQGVDSLFLVATDGGDGKTNDHADWADAQFEVSGAAPTGLSYSYSPIFATVGSPIIADTPNVTGAVASYTVSPALPAGLSLNATTGVISGTPTAASASS